MWSPKTLLFAALGFLGGLIALVTVAWTVDSAVHAGDVNRNVTLVGAAIGDLDQSRLRPAVEEIAGRFRGAKVVIDAPEGGFEVDARTLGLELDVDRTVEAAREVGRSGAIPARIAGWARSFVSPRRVPVRVSVDPAAVFVAVATLDKGPREDPVEPSIAPNDEGGFDVVPGRDGKGIDPSEIIEALPSAAAAGLPIEVGVERGEVPPRFTADDAERAADAAEALVTQSLTVSAGGEQTRVPAATLRSWLRAAPGAERLEVVVDQAAAEAGLAQLLPEAGTEPVETTFRISGNEVSVVAGKPGAKCCAPEAASLVQRALRENPDGAVVLPLRTVEPKLTADAAANLGVKEQVATFTTNHPAGQPRVRNIHRIADLLRGTIIQPGETFSVNGTVGRRTAARGFVAAPVIEDGMFAEDIGGGISQFATTLFNAAFFAGLDIPEYQAHSIYINRYPYGREATLSFPRPDLKIRNNTPYGVVLWPTYTGSSITVSLYSTKYIEAAQTGQTTGSRGACTSVRTTRTRTWLSTDEKKTDTFTALYRPGEGVNC